MRSASAGGGFCSLWLRAGLAFGSRITPCGLRVRGLTRTLVDSQVQKILDAVRNTNQEENVIILFSRDHGNMESVHRMEHKAGHALRYPNFFHREAGSITSPRLYPMTEQPVRNELSHRSMKGQLTSAIDFFMTPSASFVRG